MRKERTLAPAPELELGIHLGYPVSDERRGAITGAQGSTGFVTGVSRKPYETIGCIGMPQTYRNLRGWEQQRRFVGDGMG